MKVIEKGLGLMRVLIFSSRWLQAPLYLGLILAQGVYVYHFGLELTHLFHTDSSPCISVPGLTDDMRKNIDQDACLPKSMRSKSKPVSAAEIKPYRSMVPITTETKVMLIVLTLIDVVMIANLLVMVIIGGYETFVSRLELKEHPDQPEWLSQVNAAVLKVKLAMALIGISSIHLLRTFILAPYMDNDTIMWHVIIHMTFLISAVALAYTDRLMHPPAHK